MKNKYQIKIELLSDLCVADGGVYNSTLDIDICRDKFGFPYIPAKRLRGCLRECALELNDWGENIDIIALFGDKDEKEAAICLGNAYLQHYDEMKEVVMKYQGNSVLHEQNILNHFSYIRTQTEVDYETGAAARKSLRTMRVVNKGLIFYADLELNVSSEKIESYEEQLRWCCAALRHMGMTRTRGLGEVKVDLGQLLMDLPEQNNSLEGQDTVCLKYTLFLEEPIICKTVQAGETKTLDYIEGSKILGLVAQALKNQDTEKTESFLSFMTKGKLYCTNAYPAWNGKRMTEVPACFYGIKNNKEEYVDKAYEIWKTPAQEKAEKTLQLNAMKHYYILEQKTGIQKYSVKLERRYHHRRPEDKSIGRAVDNEQDSNFYQISAIAAGQNFCGFIYGSTEQIKKIYDLFQKEKFYYLGASKHSEYGKVSLKVTEENCVSKEYVEQFHKKEKVDEKEYLLVKLEAPTILYNDKAMYSIDAEVLIAEVNAVLGLSKDTKPVKQFINYTTVGGFQVTWGYRKPTLDVFDKGTVLIYEIDGQISCPAVAFLGERVEEGYGEFSIKKIIKPKGIEIGSWGKIDTDKSYITSCAEKEQIDLASLNGIQKIYIESICKQLLKDFIRIKAAEAAKQKQLEISWKPTINNMLFMYKEIVEKRQKYGNQENQQETIKESIVLQIEEIVDERYGNKENKKEKKRAIADEIIKHIKEISTTNVDKDEQAFITEFQELYGVTGFNWDIEECLGQYLEAYLLELKYVIRSKEKFQKEEETVDE